MYGDGNYRRLRNGRKEGTTTEKTNKPLVIKTAKYSKNKRWDT